MVVSKVTELVSLVFSLLIPSSTCPDEVWGSEVGRNIVWMPAGHTGLATQGGIF